MDCKITFYKLHAKTKEKSKNKRKSCGEKGSFFNWGKNKKSAEATKSMAKLPLIHKKYIYISAIV